jgi:hypothetical protein
MGCHMSIRFFCVFQSSTVDRVGEVVLDGAARLVDHRLRMGMAEAFDAARLRLQHRITP